MSEESSEESSVVTSGESSVATSGEAGILRDTSFHFGAVLLAEKFVHVGILGRTNTGLWEDANR